MDGDNGKPDGDIAVVELPDPSTAPSNTTRAKSAPKKRTTKKKAKSRKKPAARKASTPGRSPGFQAQFPRHAVTRALRIPRAILDQNAGHPCSAAEAAKLLGGKATSGAFKVEVSSAKKYGFLETVEGSKLGITERAKDALRPQVEGADLTALREAVLDAPEISNVYNHYRGEYLPDETFFTNALVERFGVPTDKLSEFRQILIESLRDAHLIDESGDRTKLIDIGRDSGQGAVKLTRSPSAGRRTEHLPEVDGSCFVMQPFASPHGDYYELLFKPAIEKAGLRAVRADADIFGAGKIMDQVWRGIQSSTVLVADLTTRNANVFYELGLAHALGKPVVLVSSNESDVPFDLHHIRVIYYDQSDPFWGQKLIDKVAENVRSALENPEEAIYKVEQFG